MKADIPTPIPELASPQAEPNSNLARWLTDARTAEYFGGDTFRLRADVLAAVIIGGNLAAVARQHGVSKQAAWKQAQRARAAFDGQLGS